MSQFVVYANADAASRKQIPCWLNVQNDLIDTVGSKVVVPLVPSNRVGVAIKRLMPEFEVDDKRMVMDTAQITNVPLKMLGKPMDDLSRERFTILAALDLLISGI